MPEEVTEMDATPMYVTFALATLLIVLGFIALLKQKVYLDSATQQPITIEVPFIGKLAANVPSLAFVFFGFALAVYGIEHYSQKHVTWKVSGILKPDAPITNWQGLRVSLFPVDTNVALDRETGRFSFELQIPDGQTFESLVSTLFIDADYGSTSLVPKDALDLRNSRQASALMAATDTTRVYTVPFSVFPASSSRQEKPQ
jgi:hypothetical protein